MSDRVTVSADRKRLLPPHSPEKGWRITREEAVDLGLLEGTAKPKQERRPAFDSANAKTPPVQRRRSTRKK